MVERMKSIRSKITWLVVGTALLAAAILTALGYATARRQYLAGVDRQLRAAAEALPLIITEDYLARAQADEGIGSNEYDALVRRLSDLADRSGVYYLYAFEQSGGAVVQLATSASISEREAGKWSRFREPYEQPPDALLQTFADGRTRFTEYTDEFGSFRSIFIRHSDDGERRYVVGVDVTLREIHADLATLVARHLAVGGAVAALAGLFGVLLSRRIAQPIRQLATEVQSWAARDFARDDSVRHALGELAVANRDETGELARRFVDVQDRLQAYIHDLTEATAARQKIEDQIEIARSIQEGLLPQAPPRIDNFQILGWSQPADQTGGDYFDWLELPGGKVLLTIGDVTGHGIGPALVTAASRAYARAMADLDHSLDYTVARLNELLHTDLRGERFVTLVACILDPPARTLRLVAAGHGPLIFYNQRSDDVTVTRNSHGLPLGIMDAARYEAATEMQFESGDALVLVSDGFFEWLNDSGEAFGIERLRASILASCRSAPDEIIERLRRDVESFSCGTTQADDTTALIIRCVS